jgi:hypothetical protein
MKPALLAEMNVEQLIERLVSLLLLQDQALDNDDNSNYNKLFNQMMALEQELRARPGDQRRALLPHLRHPNA